MNFVATFLVGEGYKLVWKKNKADLSDPRYTKPVVVKTSTDKSPSLEDPEISKKWVPEMVGLISLR